jgi:hypothetical protein
MNIAFSRRRFMPLFVVHLTSAATLVGMALCARSAAATPEVPQQYSWRTGDAPLTMMNNSQGYCWLAGVEATGFQSTSDYVNLTFTSNFTWEITGSFVDGTAFVQAFCQPWSTLTPRTSGQAYYGVELTDPGGEVSTNINPPPESLCGIEGIGGDWEGETTPTGHPDVEVTSSGQMEANSFNWVREWGQCAHFGSGGAPRASSTSAQNNQSVGLGSSTTQMCVLSEIIQNAADTELEAYLYIDLNNNYDLYAGTGVYAVAYCVPIPQP